MSAYRTLVGTETLTNLARAVAGEAQARLRYQFSATIAEDAELEYLGKLLNEVADQEKAHAWIFYGYLQQGTPEPPLNIDIDAGYPYAIGNTEQNLYYATLAEGDEHERIYPAFAAKAREEGFAQIAKSFEDIAEIEGWHRDMAAELYDQLTTGTMYAKSEPTTWVCSHCGHRGFAKEAWEHCPVCGYPQGEVVIHLSEDAN